MRIVIATLVAAAALVASYPASACGVGQVIVDTPQEDPAALRVQAARLDALAASDEMTARGMDAQHTALLVRARRLDAAAQQLAEPDRSQLMAQALQLEQQAAQAQMRATQTRAHAAMSRRQALALRQRAAQIAAGGGTRWRAVTPPTA
jgi:hypothetical protein